MPSTRLAALALSALTLAASGCGGSAKSSSQTTSPASAVSTTANESATPSGPLTRAQLIAKGDAICYRLNTRRSSTRINTPQAYERLVPPLAAFELAGAAEMGKLIPPPSMAHAWQQMVAGARTIAEVTGRYRRYADASSHKLSRPLDAILGKAINELVVTAKREGFNDCARFT
jgi:hypothetical protein